MLSPFPFVLTRCALNQSFSLSSRCVFRYKLQHLPHTSPRKDTYLGIHLFSLAHPSPVLQSISYDFQRLLSYSLTCFFYIIHPLHFFHSFSEGISLNLNSSIKWITFVNTRPILLRSLALLCLAFSFTLCNIFSINLKNLSPVPYRNHHALSKRLPVYFFTTKITS